MCLSKLVVCNVGFVFCYTPICWRVVRNKQLFNSRDRYQNGMMLQRTHITQNCREEECRPLNFLFLCIGKSHADFLFGRSTFSGTLCVLFFCQPLRLSQLDNNVLCLSKLPFHPCHVTSTTLCNRCFHGLCR
jgi:hypothetical protein